MRWLLPLLLVGCFEDKAIELRLTLPPPAIASQYSPACAASVEVWLNGAGYPTDPDDASRSCISLEDKPRQTWDQILSSIRGQYEASMPDSGLGGVEVYGFTGPCSAGPINDYDLVFFSHTEYTGGDSLAVPITPNLSCEQQDVRIRPVDLLKLLKTGQCAQAGWTRGKMAVTTLSPYPWDDSLDWWGGQNGGNIGADGAAAFRGLTKVGPDSCLAISNYTGMWESISCAGPPEQRACATGAEIEVPMIPVAVAAASQELPKVTKWGALVIGAVWSATTPGTGTPLAGATIALDPAYKDKAEIVYFDMPAGVENGIGGLTPRPTTSTGPSGLFGVYTQSMVKINITQNGRTVTRMVGGYEYEYSQVALIRL